VRPPERLRYPDVSHPSRAVAVRLGAVWGALRGLQLGDALDEARDDAPQFRAGPPLGLELAFEELVLVFEYLHRLRVGVETAVEPRIGRRFIAVITPVITTVVTAYQDVNERKLTTVSR